MVSECLRDEYQRFIFIFTLQRYDNYFKYANIQAVIIFPLRQFNIEIYLQIRSLFLSRIPNGVKVSKSKCQSGKVVLMPWAEFYRVIIIYNILYIIIIYYYIIIYYIFPILFLHFLTLQSVFMSLTL